MFPYELRHKAFADFQIQKSVQKDYLQAWNQLGPNITIGGYNGLGRLNTIAFHPTDANTFWVGAPAGGLWLTETGGDSWIALTDSNEVLGVSAVIVPSDYVTSNTIYIGTGDRDAFDNYGVGVLKSIDGGLHWNTTGLSFNPGNGDVVNNMLIDPTDNNILYAATSAGLYKSIDAGKSWRKIKNKVQKYTLEGAKKNDKGKIVPYSPKQVAESMDVDSIHFLGHSRGDGKELAVPGNKNQFKTISDLFNNRAWMKRKKKRIFFHACNIGARKGGFLKRVFDFLGMTGKGRVYGWKGPYAAGESNAPGPEFGEKWNGKGSYEEWLIKNKNMAGCLNKEELKYRVLRFEKVFWA